MKFKIGDNVKVKRDNNYNYGIIKTVLEETNNYTVQFENDKFEYFIYENDIEYDTRLEIEIIKLKEKNEKLRKIINDQDVIINNLINNSVKKSFFNKFKKNKE